MPAYLYVAFFQVNALMEKVCEGANMPIKKLKLLLLLLLLFPTHCQGTYIKATKEHFH